MTEQVRLCAVWPTENWLGFCMNHIQGWMNVWECCRPALEKGCLLWSSLRRQSHGVRVRDLLWSSFFLFFLSFFLSLHCIPEICTHGLHYKCDACGTPQSPALLMLWLLICEFMDCKYFFSFTVLIFYIIQDTKRPLTNATKQNQILNLWTLQARATVSLLFVVSTKL